MDLEDTGTKDRVGREGNSGPRNHLFIHSFIEPILSAWCMSASYSPDTVLGAGVLQGCPKSMKQRPETCAPVELNILVSADTQPTTGLIDK